MPPIVLKPVLATAATLALALSAQAGGPVDDDGTLNPARTEWSSATPGDNPLTTDEAAATLAYLVVQEEKCSGTVESANYQFPKVKADIGAGGNAMDDFAPEGAHHDKTTAYINAFRAVEDWSAFCGINPYHAY